MAKQDNLNLVLNLINKHRLHRTIFNHLFWHSQELKEDLTADDAQAIFTCILQGGADLSIELFEKVCNEYGTSLTNVALSDGYRFTKFGSKHPPIKRSGLFYNSTILHEVLYAISFRVEGALPDKYSFEQEVNLFGHPFKIEVRRNYTSGEVQITLFSFNGEGHIDGCCIMDAVEELGDVTFSIDVYKKMMQRGI